MPVHCAHCMMTREALTFREYENNREWASVGCCHVTIPQPKPATQPIRSMCQSSYAVIGNGLFFPTRRRTNGR